VLGSGTVILAGTTADFNAVLAILIYHGVRNYSGGEATPGPRQRRAEQLLDYLSVARFGLLARRN
jgi:hypothetical protein